MKPTGPVLAAALLLWPLTAQAQGYGGVMAPQPGYHPPPGASSPAAPAAPAGNSDFGSPYDGTGANSTTGYASMMNGETGTPAADDPQAQPAPQADMDKAGHASSPFLDSFKPKAKDDDDQGSASIYDQVDNNTGSATERRRKAIIRKVEAEQQKAQEDMKTANEAHDREIKAFVAKTVKEQRRKMHPEEADTDDGDEDTGSQQDQATETDDAKPDAVTQ